MKPQLTEEADKIVRSRIECLANNILNEIDRASSEDNITVVEIVGVLEMCKAHLWQKASEE